MAADQAHRKCLLPVKTVRISTEPGSKKPKTGEKQRDCQEGCGISCCLRLSQEKTAGSPGTQGKEEHEGCHEPQRVPVVAHTTAITAHRPLWQGSSPATHGIHNPPMPEAVSGEELN
jgi:hypothetical protein